MSPELDALLDSRTANPNAPWNLSYTLDFAHFGLGRPRSIDSENRTNQLSFGLQRQPRGHRRLVGRRRLARQYGPGAAARRLRCARARATAHPVAELRPRLLPPSERRAARQRFRGRRRGVHVGSTGVPAAFGRHAGLLGCDDRRLAAPVGDGAELRRGQRAGQARGHARRRSAFLGRRALTDQQLSIHLRYAEHAVFVPRPGRWARSPRTARAARRRSTKSTASCCCRS